MYLHSTLAKVRNPGDLFSCAAPRQTAGRQHRMAGAGYHFGVADELAGALIALAETKETGKREAWARRGAAFFQRRARGITPPTDRNPDGPPAQPSGAQPASSRKGAT